MTPPDPNMGRDAGRSFLQGFSGCLGVGFAILAVLFVVIVIISAAGHH